MAIPDTAKGRPPFMRLRTAEFAISASDVSHLPEEPIPEIAFAGRSNVGKSSLMNALLGRKNLVRTSSKPGCTTAINFFRIEAAQGWLAHFVDLPGFGYAKRSKSQRASWGPLIEGYLAHRQQLRGVVLLVDMRRGVEDEERMLLEFLQSVPSGGVPWCIVATKSDKLSRAAVKPRVAALAAQINGPVIGFSAKTNDGARQLWRHVVRCLAVGGKAEYD